LSAPGTSLRSHWDGLFQRPQFAPRYPSEIAVRWIFRTFPRARAPSTRILDLGAGTGRHTLLLAREGYEASALDVSPVGIAQLEKDAAAENLRVDARVGEADALPFTDSCFDGVLCFGVLYYLPEQRMSAAVEEICRVLKTGGTTLITVKSPEDSRRRYASEVRPRCFRVEGEPAPGSWSGDLGQELTLLDQARISAMFARFSSANVDRSTVTSDSGTLVADEWLISARK
jgi:ubiquinone/menaquinone biosynthesis C-methylase UbiE